MDTATLELDLNELNRRVAAADRDIAGKQTALDDRKTALTAEGKTLATLSVDEVAELRQMTEEINAAQAERMQVSDLAVAMATRHARTRREDAAPTSSLHERLFAGLSPDAIMAGSFTTRGVQVRGRESLIAALVQGRNLFGSATADLDAGIPLDERLYPPVETRRRRITLLGLITVGATDTDTVVYARQTTRTSAAAETALGTDYSEASFDFEQVPASVKSIGHFTTAYRENIADAAQFDTLVRNQLQEDVMLRLESQILAGNGGGANLTGILDNATGIGSVTRDTSNERRVHAILRAITTVRTTAFREPTAVLLSPLDYQDMIIEETNLTSTTGAAMAFVPDITGATPGTVWGLPIVVSTVASEGTGLVAYWPEATLWVREGVSLRVSDSHDTYFTKRQVAILADMRAAFSVQRPASFCKVVNL